MKKSIVILSVLSGIAAVAFLLWNLHRRNRVEKNNPSTPEAKASGSTSTAVADSLTPVKQSTAAAGTAALPGIVAETALVPSNPLLGRQVEFNPLANALA